jgi:hypothetical protein
MLSYGAFATKPGFVVAYNAFANGLNGSENMYACAVAAAAKRT